MVKNQANAKQHPEAEPSYLKIIQILHPRYHPKLIGHILRNKQTSKCVCIHELIRLIIMKMKMNIRKRYRYDINRPSSRYGYKSNILSSIDQKVKQHWGWVEKSVAYKKSVYCRYRDLSPGQGAFERYQQYTFFIENEPTNY